MRIDLNELPMHITEKDAELFAPAFEKLEGESAKRDAAAERIMSSVMRKVGYGMNEHETLAGNTNRRIKKRFVGLIAAAAVIVCGAVGGAAIYNSHKEPERKIVSYYSEEGAKIITEKTAEPCIVRECRDARLTVDTLFCDGASIDLSYTITGLTSEGKIAANRMFGIFPEVYYMDTGESAGASIPDSGITDKLVYEQGQTGMHLQLLLPENVIDLSRPLGIRFLTERKTGEYDGQIPLTETDYDTYKELSFQIPTEANVPFKKMTSEDGVTMTLSPYGISRCDVLDEEDLKKAARFMGNPDSMPLIGDVDSNISIFLANGEEKNFTEFFGVVAPGSYNEPYCKLFMLSFGDYVDISDITAIRLGSTIYYAE